MIKRLFIAVLVLTMASLLLSVPSYSQDIELHAKADSLYKQGRELYDKELYEEAVLPLEKAVSIRRDQLGEISAGLGDCLSYIGLSYIRLGDYLKALGYHQQALSIWERVYGREHPNYAAVLNNIGICYTDLGSFAKSLECLQQALAIKEKLYGKEHPSYAISLSNIGDCYRNLGDYVNALEYHQQALAIREKVYGREHPDYALSLNDIGICYRTIGDYSKALEYHQQALAIREKIYGKEHSSYATSLNNIGKCYSALGDYPKALEYYQESQAIWEKVYGKKHPSYFTSLCNIGDCYTRLGNYAKALEYHQEALALSEKVYGMEHPNYALSLNYIGKSYSALGDYAKALEFYQQALSIREKVFGREHPNYAASLNGVGICYHDFGDYAKALEYYSQALSIWKKVYGGEHPECAIGLNNIGICYSDLGDYAKALEYHKQALAIKEKVLGKAHPDYALSLDNIGSCYNSLSNYTKALEYHKQALLIREKVYGKEHPDYAISLNNIGDCYRNLGNYAKALEYHQQALAIKENVFGKEHPDYALSLSNVATCLGNLGDYAKALEYHQQALAIREKVYGRAHPNYASTMNSIGICYKHLGEYVKASESFSSFSSAASSFIVNSFSSLTESQRTLLWAIFSRFFTDDLYYYATTISAPEMNCTAYDGALLGKGLLLNAETEMRKLILENGDEEAVRMYNEIQESRAKLDRLYENPDGKKEAIDSLNNDIEVRQRELMGRSKVFGDYTRNLALKWTDVHAALRKNDIAIEFETYADKGTTFYIALTLRPGYTEPHLVELFNSKDLNQISPKQYYTSTRMTDLVWGNLSGELDGVKNVYFSPAGEINNIGIEYLLDKDGKHLVSEKRNYYRLTSTRELAKELIGKKMTAATLYGGIRYDISPSSSLTGEETESERLAMTATRSWMPVDSLSVARGGWAYLPGTKEEAESISSTLSSRGIRNDLLEGASGTEESFKALSGAKKDIIHIATHGFYWTENEAARSGMETSSFMPDGESKAPKEDKALTRSGLLFAGAQNAFEGKEIPIDVDDGILTAKDISRMDLRGTDLVVISACQSGLGEVTGDGVFGLQRGFKKAGVQSIAMSLWEVSDEATKIMMTRFYENLAKGKSKYDSFRDAQKYLRKYDGGVYNEPEYYAAFVLLDAIK